MTFSRRFGTSAIVLSALAGAIAVIVWPLFFRAIRTPTLDSLQQQFPSRRTALEQLVSMSNLDADLPSEPGDPPYIIPDDPIPQRGNEHTEARKTIYRRLYKESGTRFGLTRQRGDIFLIAGSVGFAGSGHSTGYLHCGDRPAHGYAACTSTTDKGSIAHCTVHDDQGCTYQKLADGWYAFYINE